MHDFLMAVLPSVIMGIGVAILCANEDRLDKYWKKWRNVWKNRRKK